jgi:protein-S-isoprenylcysteine O-methyltransferase Ste14
MDTARHALALLVLLTYPPAVLLWLAIHPWAHRWRCIGALGTYLVLSVPMLGLVAGLFAWRATLLGRDLGRSWLLVALALTCLVVAGAIARQRIKHLGFATLSGKPELSQAAYPGRLLTEGIYARLRHPRYVEVTLWTLGYVLFANHGGVYLLWLLSLPTLHLVVLLEERELRQRFGASYEEYARRVPRYLPKRASGPEDRETARPPAR